MVVAINPPQVRRRKGRWLSERGIREFPHLENKFKVIARVKKNLRGKCGVRTVQS